MSTAVELDELQLDLARHAVLGELARDLEATAALVRAVADEDDSSVQAVADARMSIGLVLGSLSTIDALGWPVGDDSRQTDVA